jgi:hypothetical protein
MKANHMSTRERLQDRVRKLESKLYDSWYTKPPNPYPFCKGCDKTNVQISIDGRHGKGCYMAGVKKELVYYTNLLLETD